jgi:HlyD family secretion protein
MRTTSRKLTPMMLALLAAAALVPACTSRPQRAEDLQTQPAERGNLTAVVGATGTVRPNQAASLQFETSGTVEQVSVQVGDQVEVDQVLATLRETSVPASVIAARAEMVDAQRALDQLLQSGSPQAEAQLALAQAQDALKDAEYKWRVRQEGYRASTATLDLARARLVLAEQSLEDANSAYGRVGGDPWEDSNKAAALEMVAQAQQHLDSTKRALNWYTGRPSQIEQALLDAEVAQAQARLGDAEREWNRLKDGPDAADIVAAKARVAAAQSTAEMAQIAAPFAGQVTSVEVKPGDQVSPGAPGFGLADLSEMLVDISLSEIDINRVAVGQPVSVVFDGIPENTYTGEVTEIGLVGSAVQGVVSFPVTVRLTAADEQVRSGMTAAVSIVVNEIENILLVPNRAVRVQDGKRVVYILKDGQPVPVEVVLGASSDTDSEVTRGDLKEGDLIVLNPPAVFAQNGPPFMMGN